MLKKAIKMIKMQIVIMKMLVIFHTNLNSMGLKRRSKTYRRREKIIETIDQIQKKKYIHTVKQKIYKYKG